MDQLPEMVACDPMGARMTRAGCIRLWQSSQDKDRPPVAGEGRHHCLTCVVGAQRAGVAPEAAAATIAARELDTICPRCERVASRMIRGRHCVSCYNRDLEAAKGKNAKGTRPRICDVLHDEVVTLYLDGETTVRRVERVASRPEAMILLAREHRRPMAFAAQPPQAEPAADQAAGAGGSQAAAEAALAEVGPEHCSRWLVVDHVCRACLGRVLRRGNVFRCSTCGRQTADRPHGICGCGPSGGAEGSRAAAGRLGRFNCQPNPRRGVDAPAEVVILPASGVREG